MLTDAAKKIIRFLDSLEIGKGLGSSVHQIQGDLRLHILDSFEVKKLLGSQ